MHEATYAHFPNLFKDDMKPAHGKRLRPTLPEQLHRAMQMLRPAPAMLEDGVQRRLRALEQREDRRDDGEHGARWTNGLLASSPLPHQRDEQVQRPVVRRQAEQREALIRAAAEGEPLRAERDQGQVQGFVALRELRAARGPVRARPVVRVLEAGPERGEVLAEVAGGEFEGVQGDELDLVEGEDCCFIALCLDERLRRGRLDG